MFILDPSPTLAGRPPAACRFGAGVRAGGRPSAARPRAGLSRAFLRLVCLLILTTLIFAGCAVAPPLTSSEQVSRLAYLIRAHEFDDAVKLMQEYPENLDDKRALSVAVRIGDPEGVRYFAKRIGVDAHLDLDNTTALIDSITRTPPASRAKVARTLLEMGADPDVEDKFGRSAGALAERRNETELLAMMHRYATSPALAGHSRMLSWFSANRKVALVAQATTGRADVSSRRAPRRAAPAVAPLRPAFLMQRIWLQPAEPGRTLPLAGFRFHADGTGELLRFDARTRRADPVPDASLAWDYTARQLRFLVVGVEFSAQCEARQPAETRMEIVCTDLSRAVGQNVGADDETRTENARNLLTRQASRRAVAKTTATVTAEVGAELPLGCRASPRSSVIQGGSLKSTDIAGDWYGFNPSNMQIFSPLSGMACRPADAERRAMDQCNRSAGKGCRSVAGCPAGQVSAVAALPGQSGAWVGCATTSREARRKALAVCKQNAGCDCTLLALNGQNINIARQPVCGR